MTTINYQVFVCIPIILFLFIQTALAKESEDHVNNVRQLPAIHDTDTGMDVAYIAEELKQLDVFIAKISPKGVSRSRKRLYEEMIYVIGGQGHTLIWKDTNAEPIRLDWETGDLFSPPLNFRYQHHNDSEVEEAVLFIVNTKPLSQILYGRNTPLDQFDYTFNSVWDEYYPIKEPVPTGYETEAYVEMKGGFIVKDIDDRELPYNRPGHFGIAFLPFEGRNMAGNRLFELQIFDYKPPTESPYNRHPWEVVYYVLKGNGGGIFHMDGEPEEYLTFKEGDVFFERSNKWHWHGPIQGSEYRVIQIKASSWFRETMDTEDSTYRRKEKPTNLDEFFEQVSGRIR